MLVTKYACYKQMLSSRTFLFFTFNDQLSLSRTFDELCIQQRCKREGLLQSISLFLLTSMKYIYIKKISFYRRKLQFLKYVPSFLIVAGAVVRKITSKCKSKSNTNDLNGGLSTVSIPSNLSRESPQFIYTQIVPATITLRKHFLCIHHSKVEKQPRSTQIPTAISLPYASVHSNSRDTNNFWQLTMRHGVHW